MSSPSPDPGPLAQAPSPNRPNRVHLLLRQRFALLFFFLLLLIVLYPYAEGNAFGYYAFRTLGSAVTLLTVYAITFRRHLLILVLCLAVPALLERFMISSRDGGHLVVLNRILSLVFDVTVISIIFRRVFSRARPTAETIFGALCVYLLIGFSFASAYALIVSFQPTAFFLDPSVNSHIVPDRFDFIYFSFGTMTELGTPGMTAVSREVRSISLIEAILGILYLAVLISRIMSTYRMVPEAE